MKMSTNVQSQFAKLLKDVSEETLIAAQIFEIEKTGPNGKSLREKMDLLNDLIILCESHGMEVN
jgi:hypothetical protein